jgi:hypothetical protein
MIEMVKGAQVNGSLLYKGAAERVLVSSDEAEEAVESGAEALANT